MGYNKEENEKFVYSRMDRGLYLRIWDALSSIFFVN